MSSSRAIIRALDLPKQQYALQEQLTAPPAAAAAAISASPLVSAGHPVVLSLVSDGQLRSEDSTVDERCSPLQIVPCTAADEVLPLAESAVAPTAGDGEVGHDDLAAQPSAMATPARQTRSASQYGSPMANGSSVSERMLAESSASFVTASEHACSSAGVSEAADGSQPPNGLLHGQIASQEAGSHKMK